MDHDYMSSEGAAQIDWEERKRMYNWPEWAIYADNDVIAYVKAPDYETARDKGLEYARQTGVDVKSKRIYAVRT